MLSLAATNSVPRKCSKPTFSHAINQRIETLQKQINIHEHRTNHIAFASINLISISALKFNIGKKKILMERIFSVWAYKQLLETENVQF